MTAEIELGEELGMGAVATVHRAVDRRSGEVFAVKLLHDRNARDPTATRRFAREVELARTLRAPNIVAVHGAVEIDGRAALVMELVEGPTLADVIAREAPLAEDRLLRLAGDIARGLATAHGGGVIHRDLKPANILIARVGEQGQELAKIADFGMARASSFAGIDRESMTVLGTPDYMAPETLDPLAVDARTDLYALGCILFEMACGRPPFAGATPFAVLEAHRRSPPPLDRVETLRPAVRRLIAELLAKQPGDRPQAASVVVGIIDELLAGDDAQTEVSTAMAPLGPRGVIAPLAERGAVLGAGRCARCGAPVIAGVRVCLDCGLIRVTVEAGEYSVFVIGPGLVGDKLDSVRRDRLLAWLRANPDSGLDASWLSENIPRMPFALVVGVSDASARALVESLLQLGLRAEQRRGGRLAHGGILEKTVRIGARRGQVALPLLILGLPLVVVLFVLLMPLLPIYLVAVGWWTSRPALALQPGRRSQALPPRVDEQLREVERKGPGLSKRHRPALRAVVQRVMSLLEAHPQAGAEIDAEMAHALSVAVVATERLGELDGVVSRPDFDAGDPEQRRDLQERDMWSARLLELTATLDALVSRQAVSRQALQAAALDGDDQLEALRHRVEALEEVRGLT